MSYRKIPFQTWRIAWLSIKFAYRGGGAQTTQEKEAYKGLVKLCEEALKAINAGADVADRFVLKLDQLIADNERAELKSMLDGTHPDVPEWLRK